LAHQCGAVDRVDGEVAIGPVAVADLFAVVEHRGVVLLALADDNDAAHRHGVHQLADRVDGRSVAALLVAAANPAAGRHRARLGDSHKFQGQVSVRGFAAGGHGADCPRTRLTSVRWDTGDVTVEDPAPRPDVAGYPAPREPKSRL